MIFFQTYFIVKLSLNLIYQTEDPQFSQSENWDYGQLTKVTDYFITQKSKFCKFYLII